MCKAISFILLVTNLAAQSSDYAGSDSCAQCHDNVGDYLQSQMARTSGPVTDLAKGESGNFHIDSNSMHFARGDVKGRRRLDFFIGSGAAGHSYLFFQGGFLFQAPVSWFAKLNRWSASPGFAESEGLYLHRPIDVECLNCHASRLSPNAGTRNGFANPPFEEQGVACERCHGAAGEHVSSNGSARVVNPAKLTGRARDSVCAQCHLSGVERVEKKKGAMLAFRPGNDLADFVTSFVWKAEAAPLKVNSHFEKLSQSKCRQASGDKLWCGTCHDPHRTVPDGERAAHYAAKCRTCHPQTHAKVAARDNCIGCHMPTAEPSDVAHTVYTDHSIPKTPRKADSKDGSELVAFWGETPRPRELGLAWARIANARSDKALRERAYQLLREAVTQQQGDAEVLTQLGWLLDQAGTSERAIELYEQALKQDPAQTLAAINLGALIAAKDMPRAVTLWRDALKRDPASAEAAMNLARALRKSGDEAGAKAVIDGLREFRPDFQPAF
ncbi:MAG: tetratricopeptide repeat protein [Bryobacteraceae bacterium]|nr:tetratricopeptide repeat protein [Bryobacteraceae bacterium]